MEQLIPFTAGGGSPRRVATGISEAIATYGTVRRNSGMNESRGEVLDDAHLLGRGRAAPDWRQEAMDQAGKPRGKTTFAYVFVMLFHALPEIDDRNVSKAVEGGAGEFHATEPPKRAASGRDSSGRRRPTHASPDTSCHCPGGPDG